MFKALVSLSSLLILMIFFVGTHMFFFPYDTHVRSLQNLTKLTQISKLSLSEAYDASTLNAIYPEMPGLNRMDFVYER